jgi:hypothetical protein
VVKTTIMLSIETRILTYCSDVDPGRDQLQKIRGAMSNSIDVDRLIDLAVKEGLGGFLYKSLMKAGLLESVTPQHKQRLYNIYYLTVRHNLKSFHALNTILEPLNQQGVQVVLMQGIALLLQVYQDVGLRPMKDIDLWVLPHNFQLLVNTLASQGFEQDRLYPGTFRKGEAVLDIHTHLLWADRIKSREHLLNNDQEDIFYSAVSVDFDGGRAMCLSPQDQFLYLGLHALKHNFDRLIWLVDIKSLAADWKPSDWDALLTRAENIGHQKTLLYILYPLQKIFSTEMPPEIHSFQKNWRPGYFEKKMLQRRIEGRPIPTWAQLIMISNGRSMRERFSLFIGTLFPRPEVLRQVFANTPQLSVPQLYWRRVLQVMGFN